MWEKEAESDVLELRAEVDRLREELDKAQSKAAMWVRSNPAASDAALAENTFLVPNPKNMLRVSDVRCKELEKQVSMYVNVHHENNRLRLQLQQQLKQ